ncbi:MAG: Panacea domain-containing protein [Paludisphaera borealis]|uniref:Panacea domain-containing protein n=1 Tax=Paludisphaera borealis TaxID=1387353 RepID=UPI0028494538|nr:Panacea domain-containing protein [Paludisphaera borealis]MDR3623197.1 Panacea domain-containing protein [Paludisphaera borealis]
MRLLKLLYIADRELLAETGRTLTGDRAVAMNYGPVLSNTYNLIKHARRSTEGWNRFIQSHGREVVLKEDPGHGRLTKREVDKLKELSERFAHVSTNGLSAYSHGFPEYAKNFVPDTSTPIPWDDVLTGTGNEDKTGLYQARLEEQQLIDSIFGGLIDAGG